MADARLKVPAAVLTIAIAFVQKNATNVKKWKPKAEFKFYCLTAIVAEPSLYWHDYETFGIDSKRDRPSQFAGIRTDFDLNIIDNPLVVYCKPPADYLPHPEACLLTGITPQLAEQKGVVESEFVNLIQNQFARPNTCVLGYNSIRFDDEFTRNCFYRNFYDPYTREWQQGNSRWDLIDVTRATKALRPHGINWPVDTEGNPSFKLEELTKANGINHQDAHDALADVYATIALAKLIKSGQPKLYQFLWQHRTKTEANKLLKLGAVTPVIHVSGRFSTKKNCLAVVLPICRHPTNTNGVIVYDLSIDPEPLLSLNADAIKKRVFTSVADLPEGEERVPLKTIHTNKCPVLAPINVLRDEDEQRLAIDLSMCYRNLDKIKAGRSLNEKIAEVFSSQDFTDNSENDPDLMIYSGGFFPDRDKKAMHRITTMTAEQLAQYSPDFIDSRLDEMLFRYRARNYQSTLNFEEANRWRIFCTEKLSGSRSKNELTFEDYFSELTRLRSQDKSDKNVINELENYASGKMRNLNFHQN